MTNTRNVDTGRICRAALLAALAGAVALPAIGCSARTRHAGDLSAVRSDPTPALDTRSKRAVDQGNNWAVVHDTNSRMIPEDIARLFSIDRPSRLAPGPAPR